jgi:hypothetical protein
MATEDQLKAAARKALAAGDTAAAKRLVDAARKAGQSTPPIPKSTAMTEGLADLSNMTQAPTVQERPRGVGQVIYDNVIGDPKDGVQSHGEALGTWLNRAGETATLGLVGDEASAAAYSALPGRTYEGELDRFRKNEEGMSGLGRVSADIAGAILPAMTGIGLASKAASIPAAILKGAAIGGAQGGTLGFMEGEGGLENRASNAASGAGVGAALGGIVGPAVGAVTDKIAQALANKRAIAEAIKGAPTTDALRAAGNAAYKAVDDAGVVVKPEAFAGMVDDVTGTMRRGGLDEGMGSLTPQAARVAAILDDTAKKSSDAGVPFSEIDLLRRKAGVPASNMATPLESRLGTQAIEGVDDFINKLGPDDVLAGDAEALPALIGKARETWARMSKSQMIDDAVDASENYLSGSASGIKNQFARILKSPKLSRGFSEMEQAAMRRVVNGTMPEKVLNLFSGGMGQIATMGAGSVMGGLPGLLAGAGIASASRKGAEALAGRNAEIVRALVASGKAGALPQISQQPRAVVEALIRRSGEVGRQ